MSKKIQLVSGLTIVLAALLLFLPFLGSVHLFDWDEINFAECAREMLVSGNYFNLQMNFYPFWEKPPLFIWFQALSMKLFGVNEFAARFPNALAGVLTLLVLFRAGKKMKDIQTGWLWVICYAGSTLPQFYFRSGIIDPWFNLFIFLAFFSFLQYLSSEKALFRQVLKAGLYAGLAVLTKGPAAVIILGICLLYFLVRRSTRSKMQLRHLMMLCFIVIITGGLWFLLLLLNGQDEIIKNFVSYQYHLFHAEDSGHGGPFYYHFLVLLIGCFPASVFALPALFGKGEGAEKEIFFRQSMQVLFWVVLLLFSVVQTKIIHYSSLCYFPLTYLAAITIQDYLNKKSILSFKIRAVLISLSSLMALLLIALPVLAMNKEWLMARNWIQDEVAIGNLQAPVHWSGIELLPGMLLLILTILLIFSERAAHSARIIFSTLLINLFSTQLAALVLAPRIEGYTQKAVIDFYEDLQKKDCYAESLNYLSYAPYFYARQLPPPMEEKAVRTWMLKGKIDKDCYFVSKITDAEDNKRDFPDLIELERKNGFVFYLRKAAN